MPSLPSYRSKQISKVLIQEAPSTDAYRQVDTDWYKPVSHSTETDIPWSALATIQVFHPLLLRLLGKQADEMRRMPPIAGRFESRAEEDTL